MYFTFVVLLSGSAVSFAFHGILNRGFEVRRSTTILKVEEDPNFEAHLPSLLKVGTLDRPSPDIASELRSRYKTIAGTKRKAAEVLKTTNQELAAELEELADELDETHEKFVKAALYWDAWNRPSPDIGTQLRAQAELSSPVVDPNYHAHLKDFLTKGSADDDFELPSELRLLKLKTSISVKRLAAKELKKNLSPALAEELEEMADEIEESHRRFEQLASTFAASKADSGYREEE